MYDDYDTRLQADASKFCAQKGNIIIEVFDDQFATNDRFQETPMPEEELGSWAQSEYPQDAPKPLLRVIVCAPEIHTSDAVVLPLPISCRSLQTIRSAWKFPSELLRMLLSTMPISSRFTIGTYANCESAEMASINDDNVSDQDQDPLDCELNDDVTVVEEPLDARGEAHVMTHGTDDCEQDRNSVKRTDVNDDDDSRKDLSKSMPINEGIMLRGGRSKDWNYCIAMTHFPHAKMTNCLVQGLESKEIEKMKLCLRNSVCYASQPMLLPIILLEQKIHHFAVLLERRARDLDDIEKSTGMRHGWNIDKEQNLTKAKRLEMRETLDFDMITQQLTGLLGTLSFCDLTFQAGSRSLDLVEDVAGKGQLAEVLERRVTYLRGLIAGAQDTRRLLEARAQAQVQTVYSLISQKHAEAALHENSRMRAIAVVTFIFLPLTAVATFFSASFWNWAPTDKSQVVSSWIWVYFAVTIAITLTVLVLLYIISKRSRRRREEEVPARRGSLNV